MSKGSTNLEREILRFFKDCYILFTELHSCNNFYTVHPIVVYEHLTKN
jgi:hypothetical protein